MSDFLSVCSTLTDSEGDFFGSDGSYREFRVPGFGDNRATYLAVDYADLAISFKRWPEILSGLSKNSECKKIQHGLTIEYNEFDFDRGGGVPRTVSYTWRLRTPWGEYKLFFLVFTRKQRRGCVNLFHRCEITGSGCRLVGAGVIAEYVQSLGISVDKVRDLHVCADFHVPFVCRDSVMGSVLSIRNAKKQSGRTHDHGGILETVEVGDYSNERNTYRFIRVYNKDRDSDVKGKTGLYPKIHLLTRIRFEVDLRADKCKEIPVIWLYDAERIADMYAYEMRYFLPHPSGRLPQSWGHFRKTGANPVVCGTFHRAGTRRQSDPSRADWCQAAAFLTRLYRRGATLAQIFPMVQRTYREFLENDTSAGDARAVFLKRKSDTD